MTTPMNGEGGTEWFWRIVDAKGLGNVPSDEIEALRLLCDKAEKYDALSLGMGRGNGSGAPATPSGHSQAEPSGLGPSAECPSRKTALQSQLHEWFYEQAINLQNSADGDGGYSPKTCQQFADFALMHLARVSDEHRHGENAQGAVEGVACQRDPVGGTPDLLPNPLPPPGGGDSDWRDIASAPTDGTDFYAYGPSVGMPVAFWKARQGFTNTWTLEPIRSLTHWRPLFAPPAPANNTGA